MLGNTYLKYIARDEDIPLVRFGFPILDRVGHSYFPTVGYRGGLRLLEKILDALLDRLDRDAPEEILQERFQVPLKQMGLPVSLRETDRFFNALEDLSGHPAPTRHVLEQGRLLDAMVDGHKYVFDKKAVVYGDEDLAVGLTAFLLEIGGKPVLCATGGGAAALRKPSPQSAGSCSPTPLSCGKGWTFMTSMTSPQRPRPWPRIC